MSRTTQQMLRARLVDQLAVWPPSQTHGDFSHLDLLSVPTQEQFVVEAHRRILGRHPDANGMECFLHILKTYPRRNVIDIMQRARRQGAAAQTRWGAPRFVDLTHLETVEAPDVLVREIYWSILGREGERDGLAHFVNLLAGGASKRQVFAIVAGSAEARMLGVHCIWRGKALRAAKRLGFATQLQLLLRKLKPRFRLEHAASSGSNTMHMTAGAAASPSFPAGSSGIDRKGPGVLRGATEATPAIRR